MLFIADRLFPRAESGARWFAFGPASSATLDVETERTWQLLRLAAREPATGSRSTPLAHPTPKVSPAETYLLGGSGIARVHPSRWEASPVGSTIATMTHVDQATGRVRCRRAARCPLLANLMGDAEPRCRRRRFLGVSLAHCRRPPATERALRDECQKTGRRVTATATAPGHRDIARQLVLPRLRASIAPGRDPTASQAPPSTLLLGDCGSFAAPCPAPRPSGTAAPITPPTPSFPPDPTECSERDRRPMGRRGGRHPIDPHRGRDAVTTSITAMSVIVSRALPDVRDGSILSIASIL